MALIPPDVTTLSHYVWKSTPDILVNVMAGYYGMRIMPILEPLILIASFLAVSREWLTGAWKKRTLMGLLFIGAPWVAWQQYRMVKQAFSYVAPHRQTAEFLREENVLVQRYSMDLIQMPQYFSHGVSDPILENRVVESDEEHTQVLGADETAKRMEMVNGVRVELLATRDPSYPQWSYMKPKIELQAGERKFVRFAFTGPERKGWLILRGENLSREYPMPQSGYGEAFGWREQDPHTLSLFNSTQSKSEIEIVFKDDAA